MTRRWTPFRSAQARRSPWLPVALAAGYVAAAYIAYRWTLIPGGLAVFWLNNGLVAAALLLLSRRDGVAVALAGFAADGVFAHTLGHGSWLQSGIIAGCDLGEAWMAAVLIRRIGGAALDITRVRRLSAALVRAVLPATLAAGTLGALLFHVIYGEPLGRTWVSWALGDALGMSIGLPAALVVARFRRFDRPGTLGPTRSILLTLALCALATVPFGVEGPPLAFIIFPLFLVAAFRLSPPYAAVALMLVATAAAVLTLTGHGPFGATHPDTDVVVRRLQIFLACLVLTLFVAQGALAERARSQARLLTAFSRMKRARGKAEAAAARLIESESRFRRFAEQATDVISRTTPAGVLTYVSPSARAVYGYDPEFLVGRPWTFLMHPDDVLPTREIMWRSAVPGGAAAPVRMEFRTLTQAGETRWIEVSAGLLRDPQTEEVVEIQTIARDVTERKGLETELQARRAEAEAASVAKSQFLANMSHEIRTPLNGVIATADLLARSDLDPHASRLVGIIRSSGDSLNRLLSDILDLARIESGRVELEVAPFHLGDTVRSTADLCALRAQEKGLAVEVAIDPQVDRHFAGDEVRVRQILTNLISNAVKFTAEGRVSIRVGPGSAEPTAAGVRIEVSDSGVGFDPAVKDRLFGRFQQADGSITRRFGGTGLGLPISRQLAEAMGGRLDCDSVPGAGARFWIEAPLQPVEAPQLEPRATPEADPFGGRVLVVDDHPTNRTVAELILRDFGFEVMVAEDGLAAVQAVAAHRFDLVLMDMQMPVMDGLTAVRRIREMEAAGTLAGSLPILMLTANALPEHTVQSEAAGADGHVSKPITARALMEAIHRLGDRDVGADKQTVQA
jgi:PAS domain S-box-containing protein